jgi:hypothetical protein
MAELNLPSNEGDSGPPKKQRMADLFGPLQVDQAIRQAIQMCWMSLPKIRRTPDEMEKQIRRIVERALKDFHEDREAFGK